MDPGDLAILKVASNRPSDATRARQAHRRGGRHAAIDASEAAVPAAAWKPDSRGVTRQTARAIHQTTTVLGRREHLVAPVFSGDAALGVVQISSRSAAEREGDSHLPVAR